ncbi:hypothetical protein JW756_04230 [Candidatus Woesearchaeota archaeon]|nr:hypothetical protein [Candidatus Woesearchaeota archaeon]
MSDGLDIRVEKYNGNHAEGKRIYNYRARPISAIFSSYTSRRIIGHNNIVTKGPNVIIGTHFRGALDVSDLILAYPRQLFFTANKELFNKQLAVKITERNIKRHLGKFAAFYLKPLASLFFGYISPRMEKVGCIPVDLKTHDNERMKEAIQRYVAQNRDGAFVLLQYMKKTALEGKKMFFLSRHLKNLLDGKRAEKKETIIKKGGLRMLVDLYDDGKGVDVPITLISMKTKFNILPPWLRTTIRIAPPEYVSTYRMPGDSEKTFDNCKKNLENKLKAMYNADE